MSETPEHPPVVPIVYAEDPPAPVTPPVAGRVRHPEPASAPPQSSTAVSPALKLLLIELLHAVCAIAERVDADHAGVQGSIQNLHHIRQRLEIL